MKTKSVFPKSLIRNMTDKEIRHYSDLGMIPQKYKNQQVEAPYTSRRQIHFQLFQDLYGPELQ